MADDRLFETEVFETDVEKTGEATHGLAVEREGGRERERDRDRE